MASRRTLGYIQNEWTCPNCNTRNKGGDKFCQNCGAPQPENVQFELPAEQKFVSDEEQIKTAQGGADTHCPFCGTRNPATATTCSQCGGDLTGGKVRESGRVMQAPPPQPKVVKCPHCGNENAGTNTVCSNCGSPLPGSAAAQAALPAGTAQPKTKKTNWLMIGGIAAFLVVCCIAISAIVGLFVIPTKSVQATVTNVHWQTSVPLQEIRAVDYHNEPGSAPSDAYDVSCHDESKDVCEQKTVDQGNGYSKVVEDCHTETQTYCSYTVDEWTTVQTYNQNGNDLQPIYKAPNLSSGQRLGDKSEDLTVTFATTNGEQKNYSPGTITEFQKFVIGSKWTLKMNALGGVTGVEQ